jgi:hypothetical protein
MRGHGCPQKTLDAIDAARKRDYVPIRTPPFDVRLRDGFALLSPDPYGPWPGMRDRSQRGGQEFFGRTHIRRRTAAAAVPSCPWGGNHALRSQEPV